ncbi:MAG: ferritin-like domain-containing protein [Candidatus Thermoplasmatota archaeon]|nr:ferritin-like domain-containing protein [Candidatus Thermoplasmatota archaeon]
MASTSKQDLVNALNKALAWELRAIAMYAHYSAYVSGIHRLHLANHFNNEVNESVMHASTVRSAIVKLDGIAITKRDKKEIVHTSNYKEMLSQAFDTEKKAAETYGEILPLIEEIGDTELFDALEVVYFDEQRSVEELRMMLKD